VPALQAGPEREKGRGFNVGRSLRLAGAKVCGVRILDLFAGIGGFSLAAHWMGWETEAFVEQDEYAQKVLRKQFPNVPIYDDVRDYRGTDNSADIVCGGFPCQDVSTAGQGIGIHGSRSFLWKEMHRIISEIRPEYAVVENVAALLGRGLGVVLGDLSEIGYDAEWRVFSACELGFPHTRERVFIVAYPERESGPRWILDRYCSQISQRDYVPKEWGENWYRPQVFSTAYPLVREWSEQFCQSALVRVDDGLPNVLESLKRTGNSIVPQIAFEIFRAIEAAEKAFSGRGDSKGRPGERGLEDSVYKAKLDKDDYNGSQQSVAGSRQKA
jgi:DNA (cytosine-5)-methyltransferase 1